MRTERWTNRRTLPREHDLLIEQQDSEESNDTMIVTHESTGVHFLKLSKQVPWIYAYRTVNEQTHDSSGTLILCQRNIFCRIERHHDRYAWIQGKLFSTDVLGNPVNLCVPDRKRIDAWFLLVGQLFSNKMNDTLYDVHESTGYKL